MKLAMGFRIKVNLSEIPEEGLIFHKNISPEELYLQTVELQFQGSVQIEAAFYGEKDSELFISRPTLAGSPLSAAPQAGCWKPSGMGRVVFL